MAKVKIKDHDRRVGSSLAVVVGAAIIAWFAWMMWDIEPQYVAVQRRLEQIRMVYCCDGGHLFEHVGGTQSRACPASGCEQRAWPVWTYQCSRDGAIELRLRYQLLAGRPRLFKVRQAAGEWRDIGQNIPCPNCERSLMPDLSLRRAALSGTWIDSPPT